MDGRGRLFTAEDRKVQRVLQIVRVENHRFFEPRPFIGGQEKRDGNQCREERCVNDQREGYAAEWPVAGLEVRLFSMLTTLGTALDVTAEELRIESYFPADDASEAWLRRV